MSEWTVRINGVDQISVKPGESVEIGRKPLRPLADDGTTRLDVVDQTKSMSKRHVLFEVKENGAASVRDLDSTNGSYVVRDNGDLLRLPADADFLLPTSPMRMQFGDVPADFIRIDVSDDTGESLKVPDLFGYAVGETPQEPDAADMSVDDILDLRAGEPTTMFSATKAKHKVGELDLNNVNIAPLQAKSEEPAEPRDLFVDAMSQPSGEFEADNGDGAGDAASETAASGQPGQSGQSDVAFGDGSAQAVGTGQSAAAVSGAGNAQAQSPIHTVSGVVPVEAIAHAVVRPSTAFLTADDAQPNAQPAQSAQPGDAQPDATRPVAQTNIQADAQPVAQATAQPTDAAQPGQTGQPQSTPTATAGAQPGAAATGQSDAQAHVSADESAVDLDATGVYTPAFEPGSVFERVAKGELKAAEQVIEVDGLTSDDAKSTQDFSVQFEIARHPELLAFLAMNPYLYDDMYAWLAARGETDIDEALAHNKGYQEYREAVGK